MTLEGAVDPINTPKHPDKRHTLGRRAFLLGSAAAVGAVALNRNRIINIIEGLTTSPEKVDITKFIEGSQYLLPTPSEEEIRKLADIPKAEPIFEKYVKTVSPELQNRAKNAGYHLTWQGDPNDATGRTVLFGTDRSDATYYDTGFGWWFSPEAKSLEEAPALSITGVFKGWIRPPNIESQDRSMYMLLSNPITKQEFLVRNYMEGEPSIWILDNLDVGADPKLVEHSTPREKAWSRIDIPLAELSLDKTYTQPTVKIEIISQLDRVLKPGDVVKTGGTFNRLMGKDNTGKGRDKYGIPIVGVTLRRFGGSEELQREIQ